MIKLGVIGFGYWGPNLVRNFSRLDNCQIKTVADISETRLGNVKKLYPQIQTTKYIQDIFLDTEIDGVVIATPVSTHFEFGKQALLNDKHVLMEKPLTDSKKKALELADIAEKKNKILMVDHTFLYTGAIKKIKELKLSGQLGEIKYFDSTRINLGLFQHDINVVWDLAPHDLSILKHLVDEEPKSVVATAISHTDNKIANIAYITLFFQSNLIAHFSCSWTSPVKVRKILIGGSKKMVVYDDVEPTEKVKVYDSGYKFNIDEMEKILVDYRTGDIWTPKLDQTEGLSYVAKDFINSIINNTEPLSNWKNGLSVVNILESIDKSIEERGKEVNII